MNDAGAHRSSEVVLEPDLPFEFMVEGIALSLQASNASRAIWRGKVEAAARAALPGGDLRRPAARDGARCGALHGRVRHLRADREGRTHPAFRAQCRAADEAHTAKPPYKHCQRPDRPVPGLHATLLRPRVKEPCSLRPLACRPEQRGPLLPRCAQAAARFRLSRQHDLLTPPPA